MLYESSKSEQNYDIMLMPRLAPSMILFTITLCGQSVAPKKVFHYEKSQPTTSPSKESHYNEELHIEKPPTPKCLYDTQQQAGETAQDDAIARDEHKQAIEEQPNDVESMKWQLISSPVKMDGDLFASMRHFSAEEPHQDEPDPDIESKKDFGYELVNHKFRADFGGGSQHQDRSNHRKPMDDLDDNWWAWRNSISYFPSGQAHLRKHWKTSPVMGHHHRHKSHFGGWLANKDSPSAVNSPPQVSKAKEVDAKQHPQTVTSTKDQKTERIIEEPISPPLNTLPAINHAKNENINELDQQDQLHLREPVMMMNIDEQSISVNQQQQETMVGKEADQRQVTDPTAAPDAISMLVPSMNEQRVRESLLKAADIARQLTSTTIQPDGAVRTRSGLASTNRPSVVSGTRGADSDSETRSSSTLDSSDNERQFWSPSDQLNGFDYPIPPQNRTQQPATRVQNWQLENNSVSESSRLDPIFLGFGQVQKNEPISRSGRTQARLSCQFGDGSSSSNMSISVSRGFSSID